MTIIEMQDVQSRNIRALGYDEGQQVLFVRFVSGPTYCYKGVPKTVYNALIEAHEQHGSVGATFLDTVNGRYEHQRMGT